MHKIQINETIRHRGSVMRGLERPAPTVDPAKTAHIIVDLQNGFMEPGAPLELQSARDIVPNVNAISHALRDASGTNVFLRWTTDRPDTPAWPSMWGPMTPEAAAALGDPFKAGTHYHDLWPGLDRTADELVVDKARFSGFIPGTSGLHEALQAKGVTAVIVTGCVTNGCCEATARCAMEMGYDVFFIEDGNAAVTDEEHNATLNSMVGHPFAEVISAAGMVALIEKAALAQAA